MARPSKYSEALARRICEEIADGRSLRSICLDEDMPPRRTVLDWLEEHEDFRAKYARARDTQAEFYAAEIIDIVDTEQDAARARVRMDARKWYASKLAPKKYGDKLDVGHGQSESLAPLTIFTGVPRAGE